MDLLLHTTGILVAALLAWRAPVQLRHLLLIAASVLLYGAIDWRFPILLWGIILVTYAAGLWLGARPRGADGILAACGAVLLPLGIYKYLPVWLGGLDRILPVSGLDFGGYGAVLVPVGLSFYSFQCCGYLVDVHRKLCPADRSLLRLGLFASFYPVLLSGPIERYTALSKPLWEGRRPDPDAVLDGILMIAYGLFLKEVVGDRLGGLVDLAYAQTANGGARDALIGFVAFALQLMADFGGYSLIAVGAGNLFGVSLTRNFRQPLFAENIADFWQRWHISLTRWIGDYVYRPTALLLVKRTKWGRWSKEAVASYVTWIAMGLWHGASMVFVLFGTVQATLMLLQKMLPNLPAGFRSHAAGRAVMMAGTFVLVVLTFGLIRAASVQQYAAMLWALVRLAPSHAPHIGISRTAVIVTLVMLAIEAGMRFRPDLRLRSVPLRAALILLFVLLAITMGNDDTRNFIYFRF